MRFVFDTNTLISALIKPEGIPALSLAKADKLGKLIFSDFTAHEFLEVAAREKFNKYVPLTLRLNSAEQLTGKSEIKSVLTKLPGSCRDDADIKFLELAVEHGANAIVSGDFDLLTLHPFREITILSPADFLKSF